MGRVSLYGIFISSFIAGLFTSIGVDPNEEIAKAFNQAIDSLCPPEQGLTCALLKVFIYTLLVIVPLIFDAIIIYTSGKLGIISAILGFSSGFAIIHSPVIGAILLIAGALFSTFMEPAQS
jgi:hypothetical protein